MRDPNAPLTLNEEGQEGAPTADWSWAFTIFVAAAVLCGSVLLSRACAKAQPFACFSRVFRRIAGLPPVAGYEKAATKDGFFVPPASNRGEIELEELYVVDEEQDDDEGEVLESRRRRRDEVTA